MSRDSRAKTKDWPDPAGVADVRRWRTKLMKRAGGTMAGLMALVNESAAKRTTAKTSKARPVRASRGKRAA